MLKRYFGIDVGNGYTKYNRGKFASRVDIGTLEEPFGEVHSVVFRGINYIVGSTNGASILTEDKYFTDNYLMLLLTGIALSEGNTSGSIEASVTIGVPATQYKKEKREAIKEHLKGVHETIIVDGRKFEIFIKDIEVGMEGSLVFKTNAIGKTLVIDIGAGTVNAVLWEGKRKKFEDTINKSFYALLTEMSGVLKKKYDFNVEAEKVEGYVGAKAIKIKGSMKEVPELQMLLSNFVESCAGTIQRNTKFEWESVDSIEIMGGGAECTFKLFKKYFKHANLVEDGQFINQQVYELISKIKFGS